MKQCPSCGGFCKKSGCERLGIKQMKFPFLEAKARLIRIMGTFDLATGHADTFDELLDSLESELRDVLGHLRTRREWVGLMEEETIDLLPVGDWEIESTLDFAKAIEAKLKEKNT
jgi:hypothetical protein